MSFFKKDNPAKPVSDKSKLVCIFQTDKQYEAHIVQGLLESNGIEAFVITTGREKDLMLPITKLFEEEPEMHYKIYILEEDQADALDLLHGTEKEERE